jgi:Na+-transporting NADH:ubiquinone oxidoreductase subunit NqrC
MGEDSNRRNKTVVVIVIIVLVLAVLTGVWYWSMYKPEQEAKEKARIEQIAKVEAEKKRKELAAQKKVKYDKLIENAAAEFEQGNWETAHSLYTEASTLSPDQQYPKDQLVIVNAKLDEIAALEANIAAGIVETVSSATGRVYVIVSSSVDGDLAMDYAIKLAKEGNYVKIIKPVLNNKVYHRVSVGDYGTWKEAKTAITAASNTYGTEVWPLKY